MKPVGLPDPVPSAVVAVSSSFSLICSFLIAIRADCFDQTVILVIEIPRGGSALTGLMGQSVLQVILVPGPERFCTGSPDRDTGLVSRSIIGIAYPAVDPVFMIQDPSSLRRSFDAYVHNTSNCCFISSIWLIIYDSFARSSISNTVYSFGN